MQLWWLRGVLKAGSLCKGEAWWLPRGRVDGQIVWVLACDSDSSNILQSPGTLVRLMHLNTYLYISSSSCIYDLQMSVMHATKKYTSSILASTIKQYSNHPAMYDQRRKAQKSEKGDNLLQEPIAPCHAGTLTWFHVCWADWAAHIQRCCSSNSSNYHFKGSWDLWGQNVLLIIFEMLWPINDRI